MVEVDVSGVVVVEKIQRNSVKVKFESTIIVVPCVGFGRVMHKDDSTVFLTNGCVFECIRLCLDGSVYE